MSGPVQNSQHRLCTLQGSSHLSRTLCPSHLPPPLNGSSQGQGAFQPSSVCPACLRDNKKQFIISLHCEVIRNQRRFPSSLGFPLSDNSVGGFPPGPCLPHYLTSPHCLSPFQQAQEAGPMKCQRARQARGLLCLDPAVSKLSFRWMEPKEPGRSFINTTQSNPGPRGLGEHLSIFPAPSHPADSNPAH